MRRDQPLMNVDLFLNEITLSGWADVACRNTVHELPVGLTSLYIRIPKTPRTEHGKNDLRFCQRTTASGDCRLRPAEAERSWFGNAIFGWAVRLYVSMRKTRAKSITASLGNWIAIENNTHHVSRCPFRITKNPTKSLPQFDPCLNAAEMRQNL